MSYRLQLLAARMPKKYVSVLIICSMCVLMSSCEPELCETNRDCEKKYECVLNQCLDPCRKSPCGSNAICKAQFHVPLCLCPEGFGGSPFLDCIPLNATATLMIAGAPDIETESNNFIDPTESGFQIETGNEFIPETEMVQVTGPNMERGITDDNTEFSTPTTTESQIGFTTVSGDRGSDQISKTISTMDEDAGNIMTIKKKWSSTTTTTITTIPTTESSKYDSTGTEPPTTTPDATYYPTESTPSSIPNETTEFVITSQSIDINEPTESYDRTASTTTSEIDLEPTTEEDHQFSSTEAGTATIPGTETDATDDFSTTISSEVATVFNDTKESVVQVISKSEKIPKLKINSTIMEANTNLKNKTGGALNISETSVATSRNINTQPLDTSSNHSRY